MGKVVKGRVFLMMVVVVVLLLMDVLLMMGGFMMICGSGSMMCGLMIMGMLTMGGRPKGNVAPMDWKTLPPSVSVTLLDA